MKFDFDPAKDVANLVKHGLSLADAALLDWDKAAVYPDLRKDYGEARISRK